MKVVLELQDQPSNIKKVTVRHDIVIGRGAECNLRLSAPQVSRRHCFLRIGSDGAYLSDLDSSNGTLLNGRKLVSGKRYSLEDGAILAVGPVRFIARVQSEVMASEVLEVAVAHGGVEAEQGSDVDASHAESSFDATIAGVTPEDDDSSMNFSVEQAGPVATEDEPTADCVVADPRDFHEDTSAESVNQSEEESILGDLPIFRDDPQDADPQDADPPTVVADVDDVAGLSAELIVLDDDAIEVVEVEESHENVIDDEVLEMVEVIEEFDDDVLEIVDDDDEVLEIVDDDEVLLVDEDEIVEVVEDLDDEEVLCVDNDPDDEVGDSVENELKNFLQGLD